MIARRTQSMLSCVALTAGLVVVVVGASAPSAGASGAGVSRAAASGVPTTQSRFALGFGNDSAGQIGSGSVSPGVVSPTATSLPSGVGAVQIGAGYSHTVALGSDGIVYAWGSNSYGELGNGSNTASALPKPVALPSGTAVSAVSAGYFDSYAVTTTGAIYAWGYGAQGELGDGGTANASTPVLVHLPAGVMATAVSAGYAHTLALTSTGAVYAWGANNSGQLGDGTIAYRTAPVKVGLPAGAVATMVSAGYAHSLALTSDGGVYAWGGNGRGQLGTGTLTFSVTPLRVGLGAARATSIAAGYEHSVATLSDGSARAWGDNSSGQLGTGKSSTELAYAATPTAVALSGAKVTQVAAGLLHTLLLTDGGDVLAAGDNTYGELGTGDQTASATPVAVALPAGSGTLAVATSEFSLTSFVIVPAAATSTTVTSSAASAPAGQAVTFTASVTPNTGVGTLTFTAGQRGTPLPGCSDLPLHQVSGFTYRATCSSAALPAGVSEIGASYSGGAQFLPGAGSLSGGQSITTVSGVALAWGGNESGQLGDGSATSSALPVPVDFPPGTAVMQATGGIDHGLAILSDGTVYAWGDNTFGELGNGTTTSSAQPVQVTLPDGVQPVSVAAGGLTSALLAADGTLYTWGYNNVGQLGDGTTVSHSVPAPAALPAGTVVTAVSLGGAHLLALTSTGAVYAAGADSAGQLGNNSGASAATPVAVHLPAGAAVAQIAAGYAHSLAVTVDGGVLSWGDNTNGELGNDSTTLAVEPVPATLPPGTTVTAVSAGRNDSLALTSTGGALAWGDNESGELGTGTTVDAGVPTAVSLAAGTKLTSIAAGGKSSYALATDGTVLAWGDNGSGSLGDGSTTARPAPVTVHLPATARGVAIGAGNSGTAGYAIMPRLSDLTSVSSSANPSVAGKAVTFTATVSAGDGGGSVAFSDGSSPIDGCASVPLTGNRAPYIAKCSTSTLAGGSHAVVASFSGDAVYAPSEAALAGGQTVTFVATSIKLSTSAAKITYPKSVTFTATVSGSDGTGTVSFAADGVTIDGCADVSLVSTWLGARQAKCATASLPAGRHVITAAYSGTWRLAPSTQTLTGGELVQVKTKLVASAVKISAPQDLTTYRAVLTAQPDGTPIAGMAVTFTLNWLYGTSKCTATTDDDGVATCQGPRPRVSGGQYTAKFAGTDVDLASSGSSTVTF